MTPRFRQFRLRPRKLHRRKPRRPRRSSERYAPDSEDTDTSATERGVVQVPAAPQKALSGAWTAVLVLWVPILAIGVAVLLWAWLLYRRAKNRVDGRLKEIKSKAVDVMDRLDALKERLKLCRPRPTSSNR